MKTEASYRRQTWNNGQ